MPSEIDFGFSSTELLKWKEEKPLLPSLLLPSFFLKKMVFEPRLSKVDLWGC